MQLLSLTTFSTVSAVESISMRASPVWRLAGLDELSVAS
jgi:hypothetical protein